MKEQNKSRDKMKYVVMDVQHLDFEDESFDIVIDKSTMDCIFCCDNSDDMVKSMLSESFRVLKPKGLHLCLSLHNTDKVMPYLSLNQKWSIIHFSLLNPRFATGDDDVSETHNFFVCRK
jgi:ubiquinone/menaquinone biosynthesis C-methylase UbiE